MLLLAVVPLAIAKNGLRIFTLSVLAEYVDPAFISSTLHRRGGFVFFGITLLILFALLRALMRRENRARARMQQNAALPKAQQTAT